MSNSNLRFEDVCFTADVNVSIWNSKTGDENMAATLEQIHGMTHGGGNVQKDLFPGIATPLRKMENVARAFQTWVREELGFPTRTKGEYLVPIAGHDLLVSKFTEAKRLFELHKASFTPESYEGYKLLALSRSNRIAKRLPVNTLTVATWEQIALEEGRSVEEILFVNNPEGANPPELVAGGTYWVPSPKESLTLDDYPIIEDVLKGCDFSWLPLPVAQGHHFSAWATGAMRAAVDERTDRMVRETSSIVLTQMLNKMREVAESIRNPKGKITPINKLREMAQLASIRNLGGDPRVEELSAAVIEALDGITPEMLSGNPEMRTVISDLMAETSGRFIVLPPAQQ